MVTPSTCLPSDLNRPGGSRMDGTSIGASKSRSADDAVQGIVPWVMALHCSLCSSNHEGQRPTLHTYGKQSGAPIHKPMTILTDSSSRRKPIKHQNWRGIKPFSLAASSLFLKHHVSPYSIEDVVKINLEHQLIWLQAGKISASSMGCGISTQRGSVPHLEGSK